MQFSFCLETAIRKMVTINIKNQRIESSPYVILIIYSFHYPSQQFTTLPMQRTGRGSLKDCNTFSYHTKTRWHQQG
uniref:Uncharacterized protein n=1 Tax=Arundo donax TaxID=35708 RepID=A0A0A9GJQ9_ARUDO